MSLFKSIKRTIQTTVMDIQHTQDQTFDQARANYQNLFALLNTLKSHMTVYIQNMRGMCQASSQLADDFCILYSSHSTTEKTGSGSANVTGQSTAHTVAMVNHEYSPIVTQAKATFNNFHDQQSPLAEKRLEVTTIAKLNELLEKFAQLRARLSERDELLKQMDYYSSKLKGLQKDHEKLIASGKKEPPKDEERRLRNEKTCAELTKEYETKNQALTDELTCYWERRHDLLGPILSDFLTAQKQFFLSFGQAVQTVDLALTNSGITPAPWDQLLHSISTLEGRPGAGHSSYAAAPRPTSLSVAIAPQPQSSPTRNASASVAVPSSSAAASSTHYGQADPFAMQPASAAQTTAAVSTWDPFGQQASRTTPSPPPTVPANPVPPPQPSYTPVPPPEPSYQPTPPPQPSATPIPPSSLPPVPGGMSFAAMHSAAHSQHAEGAVMHAQKNPDQARAAVNYAQQNPDQVRAAYDYAQAHPDQVKAGAQFATAHKDQIAAGGTAAFQFAQANQDKAKQNPFS